jgi:Flp pilus assembly protein TadD
MNKVGICVLIVFAWLGLEAQYALPQTSLLRVQEIQFSVEDGQRMLSLHFSHPPAAVKSLVLSSPLRLVIDVKVKGHVEQQAAATYMVEDAVLQRVRVGSHPEYTRFVIDLNGKTMPPFTVEQHEGLVTAVLGESTGSSEEDSTHVLFSLTQKVVASRSTPQSSGQSPRQSSGQNLPTPPTSPATSPNLFLKKDYSAQAVRSEALAYMEKGQLRYDNGQVDEAIAEWRQAVRLAPKTAKAHHLLGVGLRTRGDQTQAIAAFREALRLEPDNATVHVHLARVLEATGDTQGALAAYQTALRLVPSAPYVHNRLGHLLAAKDDWPGAAKEWQQTVELAPDYAYAHVHLGEAYEHLDRRDEALDSYERALSMCDRFAQALEEMGKRDQAKIFCAEVSRGIERLRAQN